MSQNHSPRREAFEVITLPAGEDGQYRSHIQASCACGKTATIQVSKRAGNVPPDFGKKLFRNRGWRMGAHRKKDLCPACHGIAQVNSASPDDQFQVSLNALAKVMVDNVAEANPNPPLQLDKETSVPDKTDAVAQSHGDRLRKVIADRTPEERTEIARKGGIAAAEARAAKKANFSKHAFWNGKTPEERAVIMRERSLARYKKKPEQTETPPVTTETPANDSPRADPPRAPTISDNTRILEALEQHYDRAKQRYNGDMNDKVLAGALSLPAAWIAGVRDQFFGPETSGPDEAVVKALNAQWSDINRLETDLIKVMDDLDQRLKTAKADLIKVAHAAGVALA